jgi:hypothetical protein
MPEQLPLTIDGHNVFVPAGITVAAALAHHSPPGQRRSLSGEVRGPLCGMGICFECRVTIDHQPRLACQVLCRDGMTITTHRGDEQ